LDFQGSLNKNNQNEHGMDILQIVLSIVFILGYIAITMEHRFKMNKAAPAVLTGFIVWTILTLVKGEGAVHEFAHHTVEISSILFFLMGAMAVVEIIDTHEGFRAITDRIRVTNKVALYWIIGTISFFLSSVLDNLTTSIVMVALLNKFVEGKEDKWTLAGLVIIAANAGGAWSPIGDVTTIMLWVGGQVTASNVIAKLFLPSLVCLVVPIVILSITSRGNITQRSFKSDEDEGDDSRLSKWEKNAVFTLGIISLLSVPVFKHYTHLPPFLGIMGGLGMMWIFTEFLHQRHPEWERRKHMTVSSVLGRIDHSSILFFLGILFAVSGLQTAGVLVLAGEWLAKSAGNIYVINTIIGVMSAVVDNVPLVAATMGMYSLEVYPEDHMFWELLALCAGTGGSILIIGSAAGVAVMGIMHITFGWYVKKIALPALAGYLCAIATYWLMWS